MEGRLGDRITEELAALRRVAVLVARGSPPEEIFATVTAEVRQLLDTDMTGMARYNPDATMTIVARWTPGGDDRGDDQMSHLRIPLDGQNVSIRVLETGRPVRIDDYTQVSGPVADVIREFGARSSVGVPISVEGRLWGVMVVASASMEPLPADTEERLSGFTELVGTAIANAEAQAALAASRTRIIAAADEARRRIERDLHDGTQQRLVTLALQVRELQAAPPGAGELAQRLGEVAAGLESALKELRETARGIHPAVLSKGGLSSALKALARRSPLPVTLRVQVAARPAGPVEIAAYYVVSEALTNTAKYADASVAEIEVVADDGILSVCVRDDGGGGADFGRGSGLVGLKDRVEALGGTISLHSPPGEGTTLQAHIPQAVPPARG